MEKEKVHNNVGISTIIFIVFLVWKLDGVVDWKWIWVFSPIWITWFVQFIVSVATLIWVAIANGITKANTTSKWKRSKSGASLVWDPKTNTMYGPWTSEDNETERE